MTPAESHALRMQAAREGKSGYITQKEQRREGLKHVMEHGRRVKKHQEWLSKELSNTIENFNEMFISNLSLSLTQIFVDKDKNKAGESIHEDLAEEDEEEEEEGDDVYEVEVVNQKVDDQMKSEQVDPHESIEATLNEEEKHDVLEFDENEEEPQPEIIENAILENSEAHVKNKELQDQLQEQEKTVIKIEGSLQEREKLLEAVKESHALMQNTLLEEMKKEYFKKVKEMEYEITKLKTDHTLTMRGATSQRDKTTIEEQYK